ncbi:ubiquinol-cytochrome c reductase cytochrome subunit B [Streptomyces olivaceoviridis]|uniref:ubiquinol-cytochrome c reductase cytochrome subunit B n=1 Tax=Streptomyces olivaceoviridis TaxID=1921 RepID=UPI0037A4FEF9
MTVSEERRPARRAGRGERWVTALDRRLPVASAGKEFLRKAFPDHWSFLAALVFVAAIGVHLLRIPGYLEGALRLMPARETDVAGHTIVWDVLLPGAVLPAVLFLVLYGYPFFERRLTGPRPEQHLCDRPRNQPTRTALGAAAVSAYGVLLLAGGQDVPAYRFSLDVELPARMFRTALFVLPFVTYHITKRACLGLQAADRRRILEGGATGEVRRTAGGGYEEAHTLLPREGHAPAARRGHGGLALVPPAPAAQRPQPLVLRQERGDAGHRLGETPGRGRTGRAGRGTRARARVMNEEAPHERRR